MTIRKRRSHPFGIFLICAISALVSGCESVSSSSGKISYDAFRTTIDGKTYDLEYSVLRPRDDLPHPLVIMTHGRYGPYPPRNPTEVEGFTGLRSALCRQGYVVMMLVRRGYGNSDGPDSELKDTPYACGLEAAKDLASAVEFMKTKPYVDPERIVVMGHSQGGWAAIAFSTLKADGVLGAVNISGGTNYAGINSALWSVTYSRWIADSGAYGKNNGIPTLWIYAPNDQAIPGGTSKAMFDSFRQNGGKGTLVMKPPYSVNGHWLFEKPELYMADLTDFFAAIGMNDAR